MPSPTELLAYIGAAAWLPQIGSWIYGRAITPVIRLIPERQISIGFTTYGPIFNVRMSLGAERKTAIIEHMEVCLTHELGEVHTFQWTSLSEVFSEITDADGNRQRVERDQPAIAIKIDTALLQEKFVRFQDLHYHERHRQILDAAVAQQNHLRKTVSDKANAGRNFLASIEYSKLLEFYRSEFWWKAGTYHVEFAIESSNRAKLTGGSFSFSLTQDAVDTLRQNTEVANANHSNTVLNGVDGYEPLAVNWNWQNVPLLPRSATSYVDPSVKSQLKK